MTKGFSPKTPAMATDEESAQDMETVQKFEPTTQRKQSPSRSGSKDFVQYEEPTSRNRNTFQPFATMEVSPIQTSQASDLRVQALDFTPETDPTKLN